MKHRITRNAHTDRVGKLPNLGANRAYTSAGSAGKQRVLISSTCFEIGNASSNCILPLKDWHKVITNFEALTPVES